MKRFLSILLALFATMAVAVPSASGDTWSVVAVDPTTGDVGVAGASCVDAPIGALAALVPGKGAAATLAAFDLNNRNKVFELLKQGYTAQQIINIVTNPSFDPEKYSRQYGIVTIHNGSVAAAGFTGSSNGPWAGDMQYIPSVGYTQNIRFGVSVQGNILQGENVVSKALAAFKDNWIGPVALSDRLMRALEAGSKAGGDNRCNKHFQQTALAAFIMVAKPNPQGFIVEKLGTEKLVPQNDNPWLYISVTENEGGPNPLIALREEYMKWRNQHLAPCPTCNLKPIPGVPLGGF